MNKRVAIFDLDFTLVNVNSTYDFIFWHLRKKKKLGKLIRACFFACWERIGILPQKIHDKKMSVFLSFLKGERKEDLYHEGRRYAESRGLRTRNEDVFKKKKELEKSDVYIVIASSSLDFIVNGFSTVFGFDDYFASTSSFSDGVFSGEIDHILNKKREVFDYIEKKGFKIDLANSFFFSDNQEDEEIFNKIGNSFAVVSDPIISRRWEKKGIATLYVSPALTVSPFMFLIPTFYYWYTRAYGGLKHALVHYIILPLGTLFFFRPEPSSFLIFLFSYIGYISIYEIGYLENDYSSVKKEAKPTLRIPKGSMDGKVFYFVLSRILVFFLSCYALSFFGDVFWYVVVVLGTLFIFIFHNFFKNKARFFTFPLLKLSHYFAPVSIFPDVAMWTAVAFCLFQLPEEMIFYVKRKIYSEKPDMKVKKKFILLPHLFLIFVLFAIFVIIESSDVIIYLLLMGTYLFLYKGLAFGRRLLRMKRKKT